MCLHGDRSTQGRKCFGCTRGTCRAAPPALAALVGTTPGGTVPMHHKFAFWFPFHPPPSWALCQLSFCINQREIFSPSCFFFFSPSFPEQIGCHYVQLSSLRSGGGWGDTTGGEMGGRDGFRKTAYSPSEGESSLQLQGTSTSHTDLRGKPREL